MFLIGVTGDKGGSISKMKNQNDDDKVKPGAKTKNQQDPEGASNSRPTITKVSQKE